VLGIISFKRYSGAVEKLFPYYFFYGTGAKGGEDTPQQIAGYSTEIIFSCLCFSEFFMFMFFRN
jgi:hypothetical protein